MYAELRQQLNQAIENIEDCAAELSQMQAAFQTLGMLEVSDKLDRQIAVLCLVKKQIRRAHTDFLDQGLQQQTTLTGTILAQLVDHP